MDEQNVLHTQQYKFMWNWACRMKGGKEQDPTPPLPPKKTKWNLANSGDKQKQNHTMSQPNAESENEEKVLIVARKIEQ